MIGLHSSQGSQHLLVLSPTRHLSVAAVGNGRQALLSFPFTLHALLLAGVLGTKGTFCKQPQAVAHGSPSTLTGF